MLKMDLICMTPATSCGGKGELTSLLNIKLGSDLNLAPGSSGYVDIFLQVGGRFSHFEGWG